jgi:hypothetical protein
MLRRTAQRLARLARSSESHVTSKKPVSQPNLTTRASFNTSSFNTKDMVKKIDKDGSTNNNSSFQQSPKLVLFGAMALIGGILAWAAKKSAKEEVIGSSFADKNPHHVLKWEQLTRAGTARNPGRSGGHKVEHKVSADQMEYLYFKVAFSRKGLENELVLGNLGRALLGESFPKIWLCEIPIKDSSQVKYAFLSQAVEPSTPHSNLEEWSKKYQEDHEAREYGPKHLGVCIAFDKAFGKSDCKLANLVGIWTSQGYCYSIDNESAFAEDPHFIESASEAIKYIGEFTPKTLNQLWHEENCPELNTNDDPDRPLRAKPEILSLVQPIMLEAIQNDLSDNRILNFYQKFAALSEAQMRAIINPIKFLSQESEDDYVQKLKESQHQLKEFLSEQLNTKNRPNTEDEPTTLPGKKMGGTSR